MFGRLVKYDFRSMFKQFGFIWPAALLLALVNHFTLFGLNSTSTVGETTAGMAMLVYVAILMAMFIITMIFVIQRFFKGLLGLFIIGPHLDSAQSLPRIDEGIFFLKPLSCAGKPDLPKDIHRNRDHTKSDQDDPKGMLWLCGIPCLL